MYSAINSNCASLTFTDFLPGEEYTLTLYGFAFESTGLRKSFVAASDGSIIANIDQNEFDFNNGQILTYEYKAPDNGIFSISTTPYNGAIGWFAFSNEGFVPEPILFANLYLIIVAYYFRKKK